MKEVSAEDDYNLDHLRTIEPERRAYFDNRFIDGVFILRKGFVLVDATPFHVGPAQEIEDNFSPESIWIYAEQDELFVLWQLINQLSWAMMWNEFDMVDYVGPLEVWMDD